MAASALALATAFKISRSLYLSPKFFLKRDREERASKEVTANITDYVLDGAEHGEEDHLVRGIGLPEHVAEGAENHGVLLSPGQGGGDVVLCHILERAADLDQVPCVEECEVLTIAKPMPV